MPAASPQAVNPGGDTREKLAICERLEAWANVSISQDRACDLRKAIATIDALYEALEELVTTLRKEAPGTPLNNHRFDALGQRANRALSRARNGGQP